MTFPTVALPSARPDTTRPAAPSLLPLPGAGVTPYEAGRPTVTGRPLSRTEGTRMDPSPTLHGTATPSAVRMRAHMAADLADAGQIVEQVKATTALAQFDDPERGAAFRTLLQEARERTTRAQTMLMDETFLPKPAAA